jgi:hypothetical protein
MLHLLLNALTVLLHYYACVMMLLYVSTFDKLHSMWDHDGDARLYQEEFTDMLRSLDVDDTVKGRQSLISIAKAIGVSSLLVTFEQVL